MLKHRYIDRLVIAITIVALIVTVLFMNGERLGMRNIIGEPEYSKRLFDASRVHTIDIVVEDWEGFLDMAMEEEYVPATVVVDGEAFSDVGLRTKGNNSLRLTEKYGHQRFSLKLEFDHYKPGSYFGLDKFTLDSSFQDNSYLKTFLSFDMMRHMEVPTPLCSYVWLRVNGEDWGLFLAVEEPEEAFTRRNFGSNHGQLYKPGFRSLKAENADVALRYTDDDPASYDNIFRNAKFSPTEVDKKRLIASLKTLASGENLAAAVNIEEVLRYFTVQVFVVNLDSYLGKNGHNYFLYEEHGVMQMIPWDYNLAFATYSLGMPNPINDAQLYINYPIDTPAAGEVMRKRPLYHNLMLQRQNFRRYHELFDYFIQSYFESGHFEERLAETAAMIAPYVEKDPTAFCSFANHQLAVETIQRFCLLRAASVRLQLDGVIPSTIKGQNADRSQFVDASSVWLPDLGEVADLKD